MDFKARHCSSIKIQSIEDPPTNNLVFTEFPVRLAISLPRGSKNNNPTSDKTKGRSHGHRVFWDESKLLTSIKHWHTRRVRQALEIHLHDTVPHDIGLQLSSIWLTSLIKRLAHLRRQLWQTPPTWKIYMVISISYHHLIGQLTGSDFWPKETTSCNSLTPFKPLSSASGNVSLPVVSSLVSHIIDPGSSPSRVFRMATLEVGSRRK